MKKLLLFGLIILVGFSACKKEKTNTAPVIDKIELDSASVQPGQPIHVHVYATDADGDQLSYQYTLTQGMITGTGPEVQIITPEVKGSYELIVKVTDGNKGEVHGSRSFGVNSRPVLNQIIVTPNPVTSNKDALIEIQAEDPDGDLLTYNYVPEEGKITGSGNAVSWTAPVVTGTFNIGISITDGIDTISSSCSVTVVENTPPVINEITVIPDVADPGTVVTVSVNAYDANNDELIYEYSVESGSVITHGASASWTVPEDPGNYYIIVSVNDGNGGIAVDSGMVTVYNGSGSINIFSMKILGSWNSMLGSCFSSTNGIVYGMSEAFYNQSLIDLLYWYGASSFANIGSPADPNAGQVFNTGPYALQNWTTKNDTRFKTTVMSVYEFSQVTDAAAVVAQATGADQTRISNLAQEQVIGFITVTGKHGLILINSIEPGSDGTITIDVKVEQ